MTIGELKTYINHIKDDSVEVKMIVGYTKSGIDALDCTIKGTPSLVKNEEGKPVPVTKYEKSTLYLVGEIWNKDHVQCVKDSILAVARLNGDAIQINDDNKDEYNEYIKLKEKFEKFSH